MVTATLRVGVVLTGVADLRGGGGAERYFADLTAAFRRNSDTGMDVTLVCDHESLRHLEAAALVEPGAGVVSIGGTGRKSRLAESASMIGLLRDGRFDVVHVVQALPRHLPWLWIGSRLPARPGFTLNVNDACLVHAMAGGESRRARLAPAERLTYALYFRTVALDGILTWYEAFAETYRQRYSRSESLVEAARYFFVNTDAFKPAPHKERLIVFSGRLVPIKRPLLFVEAIARARTSLQGWRAVVFGGGELEQEVSREIERLGLRDFVQMGESSQLQDTLGRSSVFVSTQDLENFSSLAMLEAMACGNAIVARDVGQTRAFVSPGVNGVLAQGDDPDAVAEAIVQCVREVEQDPGWLHASRKVALEEHTATNVIGQIGAFWKRVAARRRTPLATGSA